MDQVASAGALGGLNRPQSLGVGGFGFEQMPAERLDFSIKSAKSHGFGLNALIGLHGTRLGRHHEGRMYV